MTTFERKMLVILMVYTCVLLEKVFAPPTRQCLVQTNIFHGTTSQCGPGELQKMSELIAVEVPTEERYGSSNKADLILSRSGIFDSVQRNLENLFICAKHRDELSTDWSKINRPIKVTSGKRGPRCDMPCMEGVNPHKSVFAKSGAFLTKEQSQAILLQRHMFVPLGTGKNNTKFYKMPV